MRKTTLSIAAVILMLTLGATAGWCADVAKIGTVNFQKIFDSSKAGQKVKNEIKEAGQRMEADLKQIGDEISKIKEMLERDCAKRC
ncbi:MAG: OmpH family outer membrane protein [Desulfosarcinaceae bacterium]